MGIFDFVRNIGANVLGDGGEEAAAIEKNITTLLGDRVENLKVDYEDGTVRIGGTVDSYTTRQKLVLLAGNVKGVEKVNDDALKVRPQAKPEPEFTFYTIVKGDSLSKIAKRFYGDASKWPVLFAENREVIQNADLIYPGQVIRVPEQAGKATVS